MEFTAVRSSPSPAFAGSLPLFAEECRRRPQLILVCRSRRTLADIRGSPSPPFAGNQPLFAASSRSSTVRGTRKPAGVSAGPVQLIFVSAGPVQLIIIISSVPVQLIFVSAGPAQLIFAGPAQLVFVSAGSVQFRATRVPPGTPGLVSRL